MCINVQRFINDSSVAIKFVFNLFEPTTVDFSLVNEQNKKINKSCKMDDIQELLEFRRFFEEYFAMLSRPVTDNDDIESNIIYSDTVERNFNLYYLSQRRNKQREIKFDASQRGALIKKIHQFEFLFLYVFRLLDYRPTIEAFTGEFCSHYSLGSQVEDRVTVIARPNFFWRYLESAEHISERQRYILELVKLNEQKNAKREALQGVSDEIEKNDNLANHQRKLEREQTAALERRQKETRLLLETIANIYLLGYKKAKANYLKARRDTAYFARIRPVNADIHSHDEAIFRKIFDSGNFSIENNVVKLTDLYEDQRFIMVVLTIILKCVKNREQHGRFNRWRHGYQYGKLAEALIDMFRSVCNEIGFSMLATISTDKVRQHHEEIKYRLEEMCQGQYLVAFEVLKVIDSENKRLTEQKEHLLGMAKAYKGELVQRELELERQLEVFGAFMYDYLFSKHVTKAATPILCKSTVQNSDSSLSQLVAAGHPVANHAVANHPAIDYSTAAAKDIITAMLAIEGTDAIDQLLNLRTKLWRQRTDLRKAQSRSNYYTLSPSGGQCEQCRETWAKLESFFSVRILEFCIEKKYTIPMIDAIVKKHPFIKAARWSLRQMSPGSMKNSTIADCISLLAKNKVDEALKVLKNKVLSLHFYFFPTLVKDKSWMRHLGTRC